MINYEAALADFRENPKTWLITGVAGFIGSNLLEVLLKNNQKVIGIDNLSTGYKENLDEVELEVGKIYSANFDFIQGDIRDLSLCKAVSKGVDFVLHQAALGSVPRSLRDPKSTNEVNISGTLNMLIAAQEAKVKKFIYAGSSSTYGDHQSLPKIEGNIGKPLSPYAITKYVDELYAAIFYSHFDLNTIGLRYFNVYGKRQSAKSGYAAVIPKWISGMLNNEEIYVNGDGETSRDFCYIENVIRCNVLAAAQELKKYGEVFNVSLGRQTTLLKLFEVIKDSLEKKGVVYSKSPNFIDFREGDVRHSLASVDKAKSMLGYEPQFPIEEAISPTIEWYIHSQKNEVSKHRSVEEISIKDVRKKITLVVGARPNFIKIAPIIREIKKNSHNLAYRLVHTGQHYDYGMSGVFFKDLDIPPPDLYMDIGGGTHAEQTAKIMIQFEKECVKNRPDLVLVVGDVNSSMACSIVAKKLGLKLAHVEAGLRSRDLLMPEEINRILIDSISDIYFVTEENAIQNLIKEGVAEEKIHYVGNVMIDSLEFQLNKNNATVGDASNKLKQYDFGINLGRYIVVTLHRPSNVESQEVLLGICKAINRIATDIPILFPVHPRTNHFLKKFNIEFNGNVKLLEPLPYPEFINLLKDASLVMTDSGGVQEETSALFVPCMTLRGTTERPVTLLSGTNILTGINQEDIYCDAMRLLDGKRQNFNRPKYWDGDASIRIVKKLLAI